MFTGERKLKISMLECGFEWNRKWEVPLSLSLSVYRIEFAKVHFSRGTGCGLLPL